MLKRWWAYTAEQSAARTKMDWKAERSLTDCTALYLALRYFYLILSALQKDNNKTKRKTNILVYRYRQIYKGTFHVLIKRIKDKNE